MKHLYHFCLQPAGHNNTVCRKKSKRSALLKNWLLLVVLVCSSGQNVIGQTGCPFDYWEAAPPNNMTIGQIFTLSAKGRYYLGGGGIGSGVTTRVSSIRDRPYIPTYSTCNISTFYSNDTNIATINGNLLTIVGSGIVTITAENSSSSAITITVPKLSQTLTWTQDLLICRIGDDDVLLTAAVSGSYLPGLGEVTYMSSNTDVAVISDNILRIVGVGTAAITASQTGNNAYNAATDVVKTITVEKGNQTIDWIQTLSGNYGDQPVVLKATSSRGLPITYESSNESIVTVNGNILSFVGAGTVTVTAKQAGNDKYNTAVDVKKMLNVQRNGYTLYFNPGGGQVGEASHPVLYGLATGTLAAATRPGYNFGGWFTQPDGNGIQYKENTIYSETQNTTLYAKWNVINYTVTYNLNEGVNDKNNPSAYTVENATITLKNPVRTGYSFAGWTEGTGIVSGSTGNKTFTAQWNIVNYTVTYNLNGGTNHAGNPVTYTIESPVINLQNPTRVGYTFTGWTEGTGIASGSTGNKTFTAQWSAVNYTVTYNLDEGTNHAGNPDVYTTEKTITLQNPVRAGYSFIGWAEGNTIVSGSIGNKTFTAQWDVVNYNITYNLNGGVNHVGNPSTYTVENATITLQEPTRAGYVFKYWVEGNTVASGSSGNKTFTAQWEGDAINYTIIYNLNEGVNHEDNPDSYTVENATITLKNPVRAGYTFADWAEGNTIVSGSTGNKAFTAEWDIINYDISYNLNEGTNHPDNPSTYTVESSIINLKNPSRAGYTFADWAEGNTIVSGSTGNKTFSAQWSAVNYTVTYNLNEGINHEDNPDVYTVENATITLQNPGRAGYTFADWAEGNTIVSGSTGNKTFTAEWDIINYDISYNLNEGTNHPDNPSTYTVESSIINLKNPTRVGYTFAGWAEGTDILSGSTGNKTFTAQWDIINYTVTYNLIGGTNHADNPPVYTVEETITLQNPGRAGYSFTGWTEGTGIASGSTGNKTFTAQWDIVNYDISYKLNEGTNHPDNPAAYTVESSVINLKNPVRVGYTFAGWAEGAGVAPGSTGNKTFTAQWDIINYDITYSLNGGVNHAGNPAVYTVESAAITLQDPTRVGYSFTGWAEGNTVAQGSIGSKFFTAVWEANIISKISTFPPSYISTNSAVLEGEIQGSGTVPYGIIYSDKITVPTLKTENTNREYGFLSSFGRFSIDVTGLTHNTSYYIRAFACNGNDTVYGEVKFFTTRPVSPYYTLEKLDIETSKPSFVDILVQVRDKDGKGANYLDNDDFQVWEDDELTKSSETHSYIRKMDAMPFAISTTLVLDVTSSLIVGGENGIEKVKTAAVKLIESKEANQEFSIVIFNRTLPEQIQDFTADKNTLIQAINSIDSELPGNTTRLYDAYKMGLNNLPLDVTTTGFIRRSFMVVFSDGNDASIGQANHQQNLNDAISARTKGNQQVYVVGLGMVDAGILRQLASKPADYKPLTNLSELESVFVQIQSEIMREANSLYRLTYLSPKRGNTHDLKLRIKGNTNTGTNSYAQAAFDATDFESAQYGVYVNPYSTIEGQNTGAYGLSEGIVYSFGNEDVLETVTYWSDVVPQYEWLSNDSSIVTVEMFDFNKGRLHFTGKSGSAVITVKDINNYYYVANGWNTTVASHNADAFQKSFTVNSNGSISVRREESYTIVFDTDGGIPIPVVQQISAGNIQKPSIDPTKKTYDFAGWYNGTALWDFDTHVAGNLTLTARWEAKPRLEVITLQPAEITKDSVTVGGIITVEEDGYTERGICYAMTYEPTLDNTKITIDGNDPNFSVRIGKLSAGKTYHVRAYALNEQDTVYSNNVMFTTRNATERYRLTGYPPVATKKPYFVEVLVSVKDDNNKGADYLENKDFILKQNNIPTSEASEFHRYIRKMDAIPFKIKTVLMLDNSSSLGYNDIERLKQAAVELIKSKNEKQEFAVYAFSDEAVLIQDFTTDIDSLVQRINQIKMGSSSTDLYGSYITGINKLPVEYSSKDSIQKCFFVMLSDGDETLHKYTAALENSAVSARGSKTAYMIGLGQDLNVTRLTKLASGSSNYRPAANLSEVKEIFVQIQYDIMREANSFYNLICLTDKRDFDGDINLELTVDKNQNSSADRRYATSFVSTGTANDDVYHGAYLNVYQNISGISVGMTNKYGLGMPDNVTSALLRDTMNVFALSDKFILHAVSYWADVKPQYEWTSSNPDVAIAEPFDFDKAILKYTGNNEGTTVITVKDISNYNLVASGKGQGIPTSTADFFKRSVRVRGVASIYNVNVGSFIGGSISTDKTAAIDGATVALTVMPEEGYELDMISVYKTGEETINTTLSGLENIRTFTMPEYDVTVTATFKKLVVTLEFELFTATKLSIFPNPAKGDIFIKSEFPVEKVEIYSLAGTLLMQENSFNEKISVSDLEQGVYLLKVYADKGWAITKIVKE